jgi:hypothetical protein
MELSNLAPLADDIALIGMRWKKRNQKEKQQQKIGSVMNEHFRTGFEKVALRKTRSQEDLATLATSQLPFGTTLHTALGDRQDKAGREWIGRVGLGTLGSLPGTAIALDAMKGNRNMNSIKSHNMRQFIIGALLGRAGMGLGEVAANRIIHDGAYDKKGRLK